MLNAYINRKTKSINIEIVDNEIDTDTETVLLDLLYSIVDDKLDNIEDILNDAKAGVN